MKPCIFIFLSAVTLVACRKKHSESDVCSRVNVHIGTYIGETRYVSYGPYIDTTYTDTMIVTNSSQGNTCKVTFSSLVPDAFVHPNGNITIPDQGSTGYFTSDSLFIDRCFPAMSGCIEGGHFYGKKQ